MSKLGDCKLTEGNRDRRGLEWVKIKLNSSRHKIKGMDYPCNCIPTPQAHQRQVEHSTRTQTHIVTSAR